jgi:hypothetical protein
MDGAAVGKVRPGCSIVAAGESAPAPGKLLTIGEGASPGLETNSSGSEIEALERGRTGSGMSKRV